ncbi:LOW QUALITY PROTEIN: D-beta-hydroxybutyrate dehydrogenase, mitochondrial-like [Panulirus ornatus]|uniref:LOW QUALITY PROTEIN: D-beta-hydroxybutyrate dehydrogenase, mitochondrial-like n=1 Tax=Panulirus ornatus TaxID=150431 RepID=UPI003A840F5A
MVWTVDRTGEVVFWGGVSGLLAALLHTLGIYSCYVVFPVAWLLCAGTSLALASFRVSSSGKAVVVTGCDSGFGHALALNLDQLGFRVFAGCLKADGEGADHLRQEGSSRLHVLQMDVTNQDQLDKAVQHVKHLLPDGEVLWGLVNNAGVSAFGEVEWVSLDTFRQVTEINVFGLISATKSFLPLLRRARGRVVNMSSVAGSMGREMMAPYTLTKFAIEGFSNCLRQEARAWGMSVSVVQPGNFSAATSITTEEAVALQGTKMWATMSEDARADCGKEYFDSVVRAVQINATSGQGDMGPVLCALTEALTQRFPRVRYRVVDAYYFLKLQAAIHLPEWLFDLLYNANRPPRQLQQQNTRLGRELD